MAECLSNCSDGGNIERAVAGLGEWLSDRVDRVGNVFRTVSKSVGMKGHLRDWARDWLSDDMERAVGKI